MDALAVTDLIGVMLTGNAFPADLGLENVSLRGFRLRKRLLSG
jgi:hypothetical protein